MRRLLLFVMIIGLFPMIPAAPVAAELKANINNFDVTLGGAVYVDTYYTIHDKNYPASGHNQDNDGDTTVFSEDSSVFVTFENGPFKTYFDLRTDQFEYAWGEWNFGHGSLLIGKTDPLTFNPLHLPPPLKSGIGQMIGPPIAAQVRVSVPVGSAKISAAIMEQDNYHDIDVGTGTVEVDNELPVMEAKVDFPIGPVAAAVVGGYSSYSQVDATGASYEIDSNLVGFVARFFQETYTLHASLFKDVNDYSHGGDPRQKGVMFFAPGDMYYGAPTYDADSDSIVDSEYVGWAFSASYRFNDTVDVHVGISGGNTEDDYGNKDEALGYEIAAIVTLNEHVSLTPFFHITDWGTREPADEASVDEGKSTTMGIEWALVW